MVDRPAEAVTIAESMRAYYGDQELMRRVLRVPGRGEKWDEIGPAYWPAPRADGRAAGPAGSLTVPAAPPPGDPAPSSGTLPAAALDGAGQRPFGIYVHVPFCATRCGYCDFNTYTAAELGPGASRDSYAGLAIAEIRLARRVLGDEAGSGPHRLLRRRHADPAAARPSSARSCAAVDAEFGLAPGAEVTAEANPETVTEAGLAALRAAGFTRMSFGMQSAVPHVLAVLDRQHQPGRPEQCVRWARAAGFEHVSLDLIYGTPGESDADWAAVGGRRAGGRPGSRLRVRADRGGGHPAGRPDPPRRARGAGRRRDGRPVPGRRRAARPARACDWYEISNWAAGPAAQCRHNLLYWTRRRLVGHRPGRAQPRRRHPLVERPAPGRVRRAAGRRATARRRPARC